MCRLNVTVNVAEVERPALTPETAMLHRCDLPVLVDNVKDRTRELSQTGMIA
jgi:hypothetical protein